MLETKCSGAVPTHGTGTEQRWNNGKHSPMRIDPAALFCSTLVPPLFPAVEQSQNIDIAVIYRALFRCSNR